jgi:hypothetical protein
MSGLLSRVESLEAALERFRNVAKALGEGPAR